MLARYFLLAVAAFGFVAAQEKCADQAVVDRCLKDMGAVEKSCDRSDYQCLCDANKSILQCYNTCPNLQGKKTQEGVVQSWCNAADQTKKPTTTSAPQTTQSGSVTPPPSTVTTNDQTLGIQTSTPTANPTGGNNNTNDNDDGSGAAGLSPLASLVFVAAGAVVAAFL